MRLIQVFCCSLLVIGLSCTGTTTPDPQTAQRLYLEAMSLDRGDDSDRILELCRQAVEHDPEFTEAHRQIIRLTEDKELLRHEYKGRVQEDPSSAVFHYLLGEVAEGDAKQAHYEKAIELDPGSPWGYLGLGELLETASLSTRRSRTTRGSWSSTPRVNSAIGDWRELTVAWAGGRTKLPPIGR